ncbi:hypothetical protein TCAL_02132 [Tigriopus californicus]|uniref:tRNA-5-taurinomethyluridine 2-sulfurtransferase n=1 Tax=Tigriopus californicus TaxID=6832 RepID=A0A553N674_TIGCA|nr:hypothetical protein TCAL_02132 [Tigriopus californicus]
MSGGVDSTVSAWLLKQRGCQVEGRSQPGQTYWHEVFLPLIEDYQRGLTPNPDIFCNSRVKFDAFWRHCIQDLGADAIATGHYARTSFGDFGEHAHPDRAVQLLRSMDLHKDQTFFLSRVSESALRKVMFPVGGMTKDLVKQIAVQAGFEDIAKKKESMGICFIGRRKAGFQEFFQHYVEDLPGDIIDQETGRVLGQHRGVHMWTCGQRVPLTSDNRKLFVSHKDAGTKAIYVVNGSSHPALFCENFFASDPFWINGQPDQLRHGEKSLECQFRVQNNQPWTPCVINLGMSATSGRNWEYMDQGNLIVSSAKPLRAVTPGQHAVFYQGEVCLGSAIITRAGANFQTMGKASQIYDNKA